MSELVTRYQVECLSDEDLIELCESCNEETGPEHCLSCYAYDLYQRRAARPAGACSNCGHLEDHSGGGIGVCLAHGCGCDGPREYHSQTFFGGAGINHGWGGPVDNLINITPTSDDWELAYNRAVKDNLLLADLMHALVDEARIHIDVSEDEVYIGTSVSQAVWDTLLVVMEDYEMSLEDNDHGN